ncbi:MAG: calcium/sodium antiporter [Rhodobiaceae bacterium]|nr:calcium/sodium antiporter [Rhodobiaceae bacterium]
MLVVEILGGLLLLFAGGEVLVRSALALARAAGVSPLLAGLTILGFGTSTPELATSLQAALIGSPGIAIGNVVGSNIANILLILALAALIMPLACSRACWRRDCLTMMAAALSLAAICVSGRITPLHGVMFLLALMAYVFFAWRAERQAAAVLAAAASQPRACDLSAAVRSGAADAIRPQWLRNAVLFAIGLGGVILGARLLVQGSVELAQLAGLSETVIGLTIVAVGTSLPELATSLVAAWRRHPEIAFGNIVGSNIFNVFAIVGATAVVVPIEVPGEIMAFDIWIMLAASLALLVFSASSWRLSRIEGAVLIAGYAAYLGWLFA